MPAPTSPSKPARPPAFSGSKISRPASSSPTKSTRPASTSRAASSTLPHRRATPTERAEQAHWADFYREYNDGLASIDRVLGALQTAQSTTRGKPARLSVDRLMANVAPAELDVEVDGTPGEPAIVVSRYASEAEQLARDARDAQEEDEGGATDRSVTPVAEKASYRDLDERMSPVRAADRVASIGVLHHDTTRTASAAAPVPAASPALSTSASPSKAHITTSKMNLGALFAPYSGDADPADRHPRASSARPARTPSPSTSHLTPRTSPPQTARSRTPSPTPTPTPAPANADTAAVIRLQKRLAEKNTTISNLHFRLRQLEREVQWTRVQAQAAAGRSAADAGDPALRDRVRAAEARLAQDARDLHALNAQNEILRAENRRLIEQRIAAGSPATAAAPTPTPAPVVQVVQGWTPNLALAAHTATAIRNCQAAGVMSTHFPRFAPVLARAAAVAEAASAGADARAWEEAVHRTLVELAGAVTAHLADLARDEQDRAAKARLPASRESVEAGSVDALDRSVQCVVPLTKNVATATVTAEVATVKVGTASVGVASVGTMATAPATTVGIGTSMTAFSTETATQLDSVPLRSIAAAGTMTDTDPAAAAHDAVDRMRAHLKVTSPVPVPRPHSGGARSPAADDETAVDRLVLQLMALKQENEVLRAKTRRKHKHHKKTESKAPSNPDPHVHAMDELRAAVIALEARLAHPPTPTAAAAAAVPKPPAMVTVATGPSFIAPTASDSDASGPDDDDDNDVAWDLPHQKIEIHGGAASPVAPGATDMSFVAVADMAPLLRQIGTLAQANHDLLARQAELEQLLADARDDAPLRKVHLEYESKLADLADQLSAAQNQATSLATAVPQLANEIEARDRAIASLRAALEGTEARVVGDDVERRIAALHAAVAEQHRAAETVWEQVRNAAPLSIIPTASTADKEIRALVAQHAARVADLVRARDALAADLATAQTNLASATAALHAERDALRAVTDRAVAATQRADAAEAQLASYSQMWAAAAAHLPTTFTSDLTDGGHPKPFLAAIQTLARARDAQSASAKSATQRMQSAIRRADEAESACADARRQIDHLAEMVARAERARDTAVTDARRARAEAAERVKVADAARRAAQARLKRVLSGVYAYVAGGSGGGEDMEESDVSVVSDASVDATLEALRGARARAAQRDGSGHAAVWAAARRRTSRGHDGQLSVVTGYDDDDDDDEDGGDELDATTSTTTGSVSSFLDTSAAAATSSRGGGPRTASASPTKSSMGNAAMPGLAPSPADRRERDRDRAPVLPGV
ncbi:hypothetical protein GGF31_003362 [Allomyces arbusculus]|nr:hypothetical protein GGF31_003362 [Allomyces arbusculus]